MFEAGDVVRLFTSVERSLASPGGDTVTAPARQARAAPARPHVYRMMSVGGAAPLVSPVGSSSPMSRRNGGYSSRISPV